MKASPVTFPSFQTLRIRPSASYSEISALRASFLSFENFGDERVGFGAFSDVEMLFHDMLLKDDYGRTIRTTSAVTCFSPALAARFRAAMVMLAIMRG